MSSERPEEVVDYNTFCRDLQFSFGRAIDACLAKEPYLSLSHANPDFWQELVDVVDVILEDAAGRISDEATELYQTRVNKTFLKQITLSS